MKKCLILLVAMTGMLLVGCGGGGEVRAVNYVPDLHRFDLVDSYGVDTAKSSAPLAINPYLYNGLFDIFWEVNSLEDYQVNVRINDVPSINQSFFIYGEVCGIGRACDQDGGVICEYTADLTLSCNADNHPTDISELFRQVPQKLYLILEVCAYKSSACVYDYYPVQME